MRLLILMCLTVLVACTKTTEVVVDSYVNHQEVNKKFAFGSKFAIVPIASENNLLSQEVGYKIENKLKKMGYKVDSLVNTDYILFYKINSYTDIKVVSTEKYVTTNVYSGYIEDPYWGHCSHPRSVLFQEGTFVPVQEEVTEYVASLTLEVYERGVSNREGQLPIWSETSLIRSEEDNLRKKINYLILGAFQYFGKSSQDEQTIKFDEKDPKVQEEIKVLRNQISAYFEENFSKFN